MTLGQGQAYGETSYWDERYKKNEGPFEWYQNYTALAPIFNLYLGRNRKILIIGCGNSALGEDMVNAGYQDIVNVDISSVVIDTMRKKYQDNLALKYIKMDVRDMKQFESNFFDSVIDKGTLDSLMCGQNSQLNVSQMLREIYRVLKDGGVYILITYGSPKYRLNILKNTCSWTITLHVIEKQTSVGTTEPKMWEVTEPIALDDSIVLPDNIDAHYVYVCTKVRNEEN